jgi:hypothetical protein
MAKALSKVPWYEQPDCKPRDMRDHLEHAAVEEALRLLPADHPAHKAYSDGVDIALTHLIADRPEILKAPTEAFFLCA